MADDPNKCTSGVLNVEQALAALLSHAGVPVGTEEITLAEAPGRVLARDVTAVVDVPASAVSSMDGYALDSTAGAAQGALRLTVTQRIAAGDVPAPLAAGTAARLFTGAPLPPGADTVLPQEVCRREGGDVILTGPVAAGANVRPAGEDLKAGAVAVHRGVRLGPAQIGMIAAAGWGRIAVYPRLRVAVACTGNELVTPGRPLTPGKRYDSNRYLLAALLQALGCDAVALDSVPDSLEATCAMLRDAAAAADAVITTGGASVGEEDYLKDALQAVGEQHLWRVAMRPGRPLVFGTVGSVPVFGLPGNPVSALVTCALFVRPFLLRRQGVTDAEPLTLRLPAAFACRAPADRRHYLRARLTAGPGGVSAVEVYPNQGSGVLSSAVWAQGLAVAREGQDVQPGDPVEFLPFAALFG